MAPNPNMPRSAMPKPSGPPPAVLLYALCLVPITAFAGWVVTYGQDEEALERKLRAKYGKEIRDVESKKQQMSEVYMAAIKHPGSNPEQEERLQQVLRGGKGEVKRHHAIDRKYYGTDEGLEKQKLTEEEMAEHQEEERQKMKRVKKKLKKKKKRKKKGEEESSSSSVEDDDTDSEPEIENRTIVGAKKKAATAAVATAGAVAAATAVSSTTDAEMQQLANNNSSNPYKSSSKKKKRKKKKDKQASSVDMNQIATLTAVAGVAALVGFLVGGGSRRQ